MGRSDNPWAVNARLHAKAQFLYWPKIGGADNERFVGSQSNALITKLSLRRVLWSLSIDCPESRRQPRTRISRRIPLNIRS